MAMSEVPRLKLTGIEPGAFVTAAGHLWVDSGVTRLTAACLGPNDRGIIVHSDLLPLPAVHAELADKTQVSASPLVDVAGTWTGTSLDVAELTIASPSEESWAVPVPCFAGPSPQLTARSLNWSYAEQDAAWSRVGLEGRSKLITLKSLRTSDGVPVFVAASQEPECVRSLLAPIYGSSLVIVNSAWSSDQFTAAADHVERHLEAYEVLLTGQRVTARGVVELYVQVASMTPTIQQWSEGLPSEMARVVPWLSVMPSRR